MRKRQILILVCMLLLLLAGYYKGWLFQSGNITKTTLHQLDSASQSLIEDVMYHQDGIEAKYPKYIEGGNKKEINNWNSIISSDFNRIIHIYSFNPIPGPTPAPSVTIPVILQITYEFKSENADLASIFYRADFSSPYSAYPTDLVYTTNIDKDSGKRISLKEVVNLNEDFVREFRTWDYTPVEVGNEELNRAIKDYIANISDEDLLKGFLAADQIGSQNIWGIYSYYTQDKLGISIGVPNYAGDHVEFEKEYTKLSKYLKPDFKPPMSKEN